MGRKPSAPRNNDKHHLPENSPFNQERVEPQPFSGSIKLPGAFGSQIEVPLSGFSPPKHHEQNPVQEPMIQENVHQKKSAVFFTKKKSKFRGSSVRRSERIRSGIFISPKTTPSVEYIEDVTVSDNEKDAPNTQIEQVLVEPEPVLEPEPEQEPTDASSEKRLAEKVDYALQRIESHDKIIELLKSKLQVDENTGLYDGPSLASKNYRSMYIDSQKKIEALTEENQVLKGKLENALGKIEVYEKESRVLIEVLDKMKEALNAVWVSNLAKTTEMAVNASAQAIQNASSAAKRKRNES